MTNGDINKRFRLSHSQVCSAIAEKGYMEFIKVYPNLLLRVPQWMIASYLGITRESLIRVRKELTTKK